MINRFFYSNTKYQRAALTLLVCTFLPLGWIHCLAATNTMAAGTEVFWLWKLLGRLHPMMVHFPVSLLCIAGIFELGTFRNFNSSLRPTIYLLIIIGAISAILSVVFGWLLADLEDYGGDILAIHRWAGITTAALSALTLFLLYLVLKKR